MRRLILGLLLLFAVVSGTLLGVELLFDDKPGKSESQSVTPVEANISLCAVGDVMLARKVERLMREYGDMYPFVKIEHILRASDITFANLESPLSDRGSPIPGKGIWFRARPQMAPILNSVGFDVLSVANNHALDYDSDAFLDTIELLKQNNIRPVGGGKDLAEARQPVIFEKDGLKVGFLAYTIFADVLYSSSYPRMFRATDNQSGVAPLVKEFILEDLSILDPEVDYTIISFHWGTEYRTTPTDSQRELAHQLIDAGADIIIGHHPHIIQGLERYKDGLIAYSLGNFIFDQNQHVFTRQGLILKLDLKEDGIDDIRVLPVFINESQPFLLEGEEAKQLLTKLQNYCRELNTEASIVGNRLNILDEGMQSQ